MQAPEANTPVSSLVALSFLNSFLFQLSLLPGQPPADSQSGSCFEKSDCKCLEKGALTACSESSPTLLSQARRPVNPKPGAQTLRKTWQRQHGTPCSSGPRFQDSGHCTGTALCLIIHISQMRKSRPRNKKGRAQSHRIRPRQLGQAQAPGLPGTSTPTLGQVWGSC